MVDLSDRLTRAMAHRGVDTAELSKGAGVSYQGIRKVLDGQTKSMLTKTAAGISKYCGIDSHWLATGEGQMLPPGGSPRLGPDTARQDSQPEDAGTMNNLRRVPIVGTARMGDDGFYAEISSLPGAGDGHIDIATGDPNAYGLRVRGISMAPAIRDGWYVVVEPNGQLVQGEYVLIKLADGKKMVKELLFQRAGSYEIMSVNGEERRTIYNDEIEGIQAVGAVVPPSKWKPD